MLLDNGLQRPESFKKNIEINNKKSATRIKILREQQNLTVLISKKNYSHKKNWG